MGREKAERVKVVYKHYYPPSYYRYQKEHPAISIRLTKELKEMLDKVKGDMSYSDVVKKLLTKDLKEIYERAFDEGYKRAFNEYAIWYYCVVCGE
ncbi:MAG: hypothetical protein QXT64_06640, partial [Desulfurococcaceae archaeon]